ncbi:hypothetical protein BOSE62_80124 [Bosea sp. 62]|nr:hypothetical protein BOSE46_40554 [Bosea sp. 46]CAD5291107.1 hypothetical protein BOSE21B_80026 [Bosea sp. 21B]CAD5300472.1 hypothetical protein BOSE7B_70004 [Bosea sp. 7B]VVT59342.1 hypothetical protein BOS5A_210133 [Bosea sp. EC-HK365B]VXB06994.1 hypothetical protein BOSE125_110025 [Bosea sp. 125]VXB87408.1 hypothetical protein BOSE127_160027 [Bosea sp. 127]VXC39970.1 hypothetical protein BOSE29B_30882 [Bosea sp. 29B]VXC96348.1 hypothetical protein BOSE62_80124 [Bosea sp. 62]
MPFRRRRRFETHRSTRLSPGHVGSGIVEARASGRLDGGTEFSHPGHRSQALPPPVAGIFEKTFH